MTKSITCLGQRNKFMKDDTKPPYTVNPVIFTHVTCTCTVQGTVSDCGDMTTVFFRIKPRSRYKKRNIMSASKKVNALNYN